VQASPVLRGGDVVRPHLLTTAIDAAMRPRHRPVPAQRPIEKRPKVDVHTST
jgi:hypothetical protein